LQVARVKDDEMAKIKLEEKENFRRELEKARKDVSEGIFSAEWQNFTPVSLKKYKLNMLGI